MRKSSFNYNKFLNNKFYASGESIKSETGGLNLPLTDRIFFYCSFQYNFVKLRKAKKDTKTSNIGFNVDLAAMAHILEIIMKQPLQSRLRLLFDLHDIDGDGSLNREELKSVMDSLLSMFEKSRQLDDPELMKVHQQGENEELYLSAISSFLASALKLGKGDTISHRVKTLSEDKQNPLEDDEDIALQPKNENNLLNTKGEETFKLGFNEFLLAVLSQSIFVDFFERILTYSVKASGDVLITRTSQTS